MLFLAGSEGNDPFAGLPFAVVSYSCRGVVEYEGGVVRDVEFDAATRDGCVRIL